MLHALNAVLNALLWAFTREVRPVDIRSGTNERTRRQMIEVRYAHIEDRIMDTPALGHCRWSGQIWQLLQPLSGGIGPELHIDIIGRCGSHVLEDKIEGQ